MSEIVSIEEEKENHKDEWLLFEVTEVDVSRGPVKGRLLCHSKDRKEVHRAAMEVREGDFRLLRRRPGAAGRDPGAVMESVAFRRGRLILVPVELSRLGPSWLTMVVDTGSPVTIVGPDAAMEIGLEMREAPGTKLLGSPAPPARRRGRWTRSRSSA